MLLGEGEETAGIVFVIVKKRPPRVGPSKKGRGENTAKTRDHALSSSIGGNGLQRSTIVRIWPACGSAGGRPCVARDGCCSGWSGGSGGRPNFTDENLTRTPDRGSGQINIPTQRRLSFFSGTARTGREAGRSTQRKQKKNQQLLGLDPGNHTHTHTSTSTHPG